MSAKHVPTDPPASNGCRSKQIRGEKKVLSSRFELVCLCPLKKKHQTIQSLTSDPWLARLQRAGVPVPHTPWFISDSLVSSAGWCGGIAEESLTTPSFLLIGLQLDSSDDYTPFTRRSPELIACSRKFVMHTFNQTAEPKTHLSQLFWRKFYLCFFSEANKVCDSRG